LSKPTILVTGGTGYIGSHTVVTLLENGYDVAIVDNLCNSAKSTLSGIEKITEKYSSLYTVWSSKGCG